MDFDKLSVAVGELDEDTMLALVNDVMANGGADAHKAVEACQKGLDTVGRLFEEGEYFVGDLIYAGELMTEALNILKPGLASNSSDSSERAEMVFCTVKGDLHDIGKNIVKTMLEANGFDVIDLGIDVPPEKVVEAVKKHNVSIVALSGVLTLSIDSMKETVALLRKECPQCHIVVGGAPLNEDSFTITGADEWAQSPQKTVNICKSWIK